MQFPAQPHLLIYKRFYHQIHLLRPPFFIFGSSSKGNSVFLKPFQTLVDIGLPLKVYRKMIPNFFLNVKYLVITHSHGDHFYLPTFRYILKMCPNVRVIMRPQLYYRLTSIQFQYRERHYFTSAAQILRKHRHQIIFANHVLNLVTTFGHHFQIIPYTVEHGKIKNLAVEIKDQKQRWLYSTDLDSVHGNVNRQITGLPLNMSHPFDMIMLEANYNRNLVDPLIAKRNKNGKYSYAEENKRHLSEQTSFAYANRMLKDTGLYVPLHASRSFGNYSQNTEIEQGDLQHASVQKQRSTTKQG